MIPSILKLLDFAASPSVSITVPTTPGLEYTLPTNRAHYILPENRAHYILDEED